MVIKISNEALTNKDALKETVDNNEWRVLKVIPRPGPGQAFRFPLRMSSVKRLSAGVAGFAIGRRMPAEVEQLPYETQVDFYNTFTFALFFSMSAKDTLARR